MSIVILKLMSTYFMFKNISFIHEKELETWKRFGNSNSLLAVYIMETVLAVWQANGTLPKLGSSREELHSFNLAGLKKGWNEGLQYEENNNPTIRNYSTRNLIQLVAPKINWQFTKKKPVVAATMYYQKKIGHRQFLE